jgi:hypothetical protein
MDQSEFDIEGDLPQRAGRSQGLVRVIDSALPEDVVRRARRAIAAIGSDRLRSSYFTTFWLPRGAAPAHALEEAVRALWAKAAPFGACGAEWWIGRSYTTRLPIEFHFDQDVRGRRLRHPQLSTVFFFNTVRGGHLAVTDQRRGQRAATALTTVKPRRNRYAIFAGNLLHGVLDARGRSPARPIPGPRGRLRVTLVVNFWRERPTSVPTWNESDAYPALR